MTERLYIVAAKRTPLTRFLGAQSHHSAAQLGSHIARTVLMQSGLDGSELDGVILGQSLAAGQGVNVARQISLDAGIPEDISASSVNMGALSGMKALIDACAQIKAGDADLMLALAAESPSNCGFLQPAALRHGHPHGHFTALDLLNTDANPMSEHADALARRYRISRETQDAYTHQSRQNALNARENGHFVREISAIDIGHDHILELGAEHLAKLPALYGSISAGNRAAPADGAAAMLIAGHSALRRFNLQPLVEIVGYGLGGMTGESGALAAVSAIAQALDRSDHLLADIEQIEIEENHAADVLAVLHELGEQHDAAVSDLQARTNPCGGALAFGHPLACAGQRLVTTLAYALARNNRHLGLAAQGSGDGQGAAVILQR